MLFGGVSLRENITYGLEGIEKKDVHQAARMAAIHDFIIALPDGYDTIVGERGVTLSGGERQRVGLARALLRRPKVMIFDECTSSLDSLSESKCQEALVELHRSQPSLTMLTIAHRLSTVVDADRILVMANGKIVEEGTHAELLEKGGMYKELVLHQLHEEAIHHKALVEE
jgi:ABC-type multidrug transport system fused ATPase/permease subunit